MAKTQDSNQPEQLYADEPDSVALISVMQHRLDNDLSRFMFSYQLASLRAAITSKVRRPGDPSLSEMSSRLNRVARAIDAVPIGDDYLRPDRTAKAFLRYYSKAQDGREPDYEFYITSFAESPQALAQTGPIRAYGFRLERLGRDTGYFAEINLSELINNTGISLDTTWKPVRVQRINRAIAYGDPLHLVPGQEKHHSKTRRYFTSTLSAQPATERAVHWIDGLVALEKLGPHVGGRQRNVVMQQIIANMRAGSTDADLIKILMKLADTLTQMPVTYEQKNLGDQSIAYLHMYAGNYDCYITERDIGGEGGDPHSQAFGLCMFDRDVDSAELGYVDINELAKAKVVELDFYWKPKTIGEIKADLRAEANRRSAPGQNDGPGM